MRHDVMSSGARVLACQIGDASRVYSVRTEGREKN
jgi:hypothetical protein